LLNQGNGTFLDVTTPQAAAYQIRSGNLYRLLVGTGGTPENRARIMQSLVALVLAFAGGYLSRFLYTSRPRHSEHAPLDPPVSGVSA
jgi:hypothetical protein